jgi:hypothetical protein
MIFPPVRVVLVHAGQYKDEREKETPTWGGDFFTQFRRMELGVPFDPPKIGGTIDDADNANRVVGDRVEGEPPFHQKHAGGLRNIGPPRSHLGMIR